MASKRTQIVFALVDLFKGTLDGATLPYTTNMYENVYPTQIFFDEVTDFPTICLSQGVETRQYLPGNFKWAFLGITIRIYVNQENAKDALEAIFADIELLLDNNNTLIVDGNSLCTDIRIQTISDDEGLLEPIGVGEIELRVQYPV